METPSNMRMKIMDKAGTDEDFRARLLHDPKGTIGQESGITLPASVAIEVHEEDGRTGHLVLPPSSRLSAGDLRHVAGCRGRGQYRRRCLRRYWGNLGRSERRMSRWHRVSYR